MMARESINIGRFTPDSLNKLLMKAASFADTGERIGFLSERFKGTPYVENTLIGSDDTNEVFVIDFEGVDCFTFIDYIEAMRLSSSFADFRECLKKIRYRSGSISFVNRNHFFNDWREFNGAFVEDVTDKVGLQDTRTIRKVLNQREDGSFIVPGIGPVERDVRFIASSSLDVQIISRIKTGDYIGIYSDRQGLDVSHVGIFIRQANVAFFRHASSIKEVRKVVDQDFVEYVKKKPGIIILRPKEASKSCCVIPPHT
ncbi:MAG: N-acetylmuramoyl-L-alanine amidase-like domain-containing protein [Dissulfurispiraceae bacterium]